MSQLSGESPAEEFLRNQSIISRRSEQRRAVLGCVGCRWLKAAEQGEDARFYGLEIVHCTGIESGVVYPILGVLAENGLIVREQEDINPVTEQRPRRVYYYPADSELGEAFWDNLEVPKECPLERDAQ